MTRHNANGSTVRYLQLAHNVWDPKTKSAKAHVIHNFGREDQIDREGIRRLIHSLARLLPAGEAQHCTEPTADQAAILAALGTEPPPRYWDLQPGTAQPQA